MNVCAFGRNASKSILHWIEGYCKCFPQILWTYIEVTPGKIPAVNHSKALKLINNS